METPAGTKRRTVYGKTRGEVRDKLAKALAERADGLVFDDENMTVGEYVTRWLEDSAKGGLAHRTYANYKLQLRRHIVPAIGRVKLAKLNPAHVQGLYAAKLREGLKPSSVRYMHSVLRRSLEQAVRWNLIPRNQAAIVDPPKVWKEEIKPLDPEQARAFLRAAGEAGDRYEALYVLSLAAGLRMGEALGLKWSDVDLAGGSLRVNRQLQRMRREEDAGKPGRLVFSEPKNASRRTVDLPQRALAVLKRHRKRQLEEKLKAGSAYEDSGLVFTTAKGTPLDAQNVVNRHFKPLLKLAGLPDIRWHDLRHSCFTLLLSRGAHPKFVQHLAGHASIQLTLNRYSHWMPTMGKHTASAMDEALDEAGREDAPNDEKGAIEG
ncbi:MAG TPA: site-specific integrase [Rubrobacter sp.]